MSIFIHSTSPQALAIISVYAKKTFDFQHQQCVVLLPQMCCSATQSSCEGNNIDINKLKMKARVEHFFFQAFKKNYIVIWSYMLLEDVREVFRLLVLEEFVKTCFFFWM